MVSQVVSFTAPLRRAGKSNSGEGGEDPVRWDVMQNVDADGVSPSLPHLKGLQNGDMATSRIKQVHLMPLFIGMNMPATV